jgi:hypothetical protein
MVEWICEHIADILIEGGVVVPTGSRIDGEVGLPGRGGCGTGGVPLEGFFVVLRLVIGIVKDLIYVSYPSHGSPSFSQVFALNLLQEASHAIACLLPFLVRWWT